ncbi:amidase domain-containing protein [Laceyella tengchongensis]|jgi:hypothetical protein|uniref:amidase domain-containing protein n=1 Tax=Laceyella tengchongensis TaxID=574699 RepID=UPI0012B9AB0F|nr:hypothetical protein [Laceyella tengchongensis]
MAKNKLKWHLLFCLIILNSSILFQSYLFAEESPYNLSRAYQFVEQMLKEQKKVFEAGTPLENRINSKLTSNDETVFYYISETKIYKKKLISFKYKIDDLKVEEGKSSDKILIKAYITREFDFGYEALNPIFGDHIELEVDKTELTKNTLNVRSTNQIDLSKAKIKHNDAKSKTDLNTYLKRAESSKKLSVTINSNNGSTVSNRACTNNCWNRIKAKNYAYYWAAGHGRNPKYGGFKYNCTNFVSQSLHEGGIAFQSNWYNKVVNGKRQYTYTFVNAYSLDRHLWNKKIANDGRNKGKVQHADVYFYDPHNSVGLKYPDGHADHAAIVTGFLSGGRVLVSYNSNDRRNVSYTFYRDVEGGAMWRYHIK